MRLLLCCLLLSRASSLATTPRLRASEIKARLQRLGISSAGYFEKEELLSLLRSRAPEACGAGHAVALEYLTAAQGAMGAGVMVDSKRYFGIRLSVPRSPPSADTQVLWLLDSAASNSLLTPAASSLLGARATGVRATSDTATSVGVGGFQQVDLGKVELVGGLACGVLMPVVLDLPISTPVGGGEVGLLGLDFLSRFDIELLLRPSPYAVFHPPGTAGRADGAIRTAGMTKLSTSRLPSGLLATRVRLGADASKAAEVQAVVDLGSSCTVCNEAAAAAAGFDVRGGDPRLVLTDQFIAGATGEPVRVREATFQLGLGEGAESRETARTLGVAELPVFAAIGLPGPAVVLGIDTLAPAAEEERGSRVVLAARDGTVWVD